MASNKFLGEIPETFSKPSERRSCPPVKARNVCSEAERNSLKTMAGLNVFNEKITAPNATKPHITEINMKNPQYEQLLADVWVGIVLTVVLLSCVCCMCSCLLYHKFQIWKRSVLRNNEEPEIGSSTSMNVDCESLPSYTIASGLPTYEEALQQMKTSGRPNKKPDGLLKEDSSNASHHMGMTQLDSKSSVLDYLNSFVREKT